MTTRSFSLKCADDPTSPPPGTVDLRWASDGAGTESLESDLGWWLAPWTDVSLAAIDLFRVAAGAYMADMLTPRPVTFRREIELTIAVTDSDRWTDNLLDDLCGLLHWLTGDQWSLTVSVDAKDRETLTLGDLVNDESPTALLSGGLDSYLGAIHLLAADPSVRFVGHKDSAKVVRRAQNAVGHWLGTAYTPAPSYTRSAFKQAQNKKERSARSRSLLFASLGIAAATSTGGHTLYIPENGYTSLNVPLHPNRAGALSTRSTHPATFERLSTILATMEIPVELNNPFASMTKGDVMTAVAGQSPPARWLETSWLTISCGKLNGGRLPGGDPNLNCGLCVPCMVRRGTYIAAGQNDGTRYLVDEMTGVDRDYLVKIRRDDLDAIAYATGEPVDDDLIDAQSWPAGYDLDSASELVQRGLDELASVPNP